MSLLNEIPVENWESFEKQLSDLHGSLDDRASSLLFRGQSNSSWSLTTTLERAGSDHMSFSEYYRLITSSIGAAVGTFATVDVPAYDDEVNKSFRDLELLISFNRYPPQDLYQYMVYLRHHGFPSPLLDWSRSRYVAAFFAFREPLPNDGHRSIYVCEMPQGMKGGAVGEPSIRHMGPYVRSHRRHFRQQSNYTICGSFEGDSWSYHPHEPVFGNRHADSLWKFTIRSTERLKVLQILDEYNLNAFSLFDSEETLLETMWFREGVLRKLKKRKSAS